MESVIRQAPALGSRQGRPTAGAIHHSDGSQRLREPISVVGGWLDSVESGAGRHERVRFEGTRVRPAVGGTPSGVDRSARIVPLSGEAKLGGLQIPGPLAQGISGPGICSSASETVICDGTFGPVSADPQAVDWMRKARLVPCESGFILRGPGRHASAYPFSGQRG